MILLRQPKQYIQTFLTSSSDDSQLVTATLYHAVPEQTNNDNLHTASMFEINPECPGSHRILAVSRDLEELGFTLGSVVRISQACEMNGIWYIEDRMNKRWRNKIDFLVNDKIKYGKWYNVKIEKIN